MAPGIRDGGIRFQIWPNDHTPPHVHAYFKDEDILINLKTAEFLTPPPAGQGRKIMKIFLEHRATLLQIWNELHNEEEGNA